MAREWLVTGRADGPIAELCDEVVVCTPAIEESWCHTASYTCAVAAIAALHGEDIGWLPGAVEEALAAPLPEVGEQERFLVAGAGRDLATAHEAVLKLREGAWVAAEAYETEQLLHGYLAAVDESVRAFVLEGEGVAAERAAAAAAALREARLRGRPATDAAPRGRRRARSSGSRSRSPSGAAASRTGSAVTTRAGSRPRRRRRPTTPPRGRPRR